MGNPSRLTRSLAHTIIQVEEEGHKRAARTGAAARSRSTSGLPPRGARVPDTTRGQNNRVALLG